MLRAQYQGAPARPKGSVRVGIDIGGTFTDFVAIDGLGAVHHLKTPTVPADPVLSVARGLEVLAEHGLNVSDVDYVVHGTTLAINTVIQRSGARVALLVTEGFRDLLELGRLRLPLPWSFYSTRPLPLVPRELVVPVRERVRVDGSIETALSDQEMNRVADEVAALGVDSVAICLLHSYGFPGHELALEAVLHERRPECLVSRSSAIWPQSREYERALVTVMNAYIQPAMTQYLSRLEATLRGVGVVVRPYIAKSNGGIMTAAAARDHVVQTLLSGPAAGVVGAIEVAARAQTDNVITLDMGGTSADVAVIRAGVPVASHEERVGDFPVVVPAVGVSAIGAGGGSIAWLDAAGILKVGPRSAGSEPGPACYANGGTEPTLTDAFLIGGYLAADRFAGRGKLDAGSAYAALAKLGEPLSLGVEETADAIIRVALANMYTELSSVMERHGLDQREFTLLPLGGAGPVLAAALAEELRIGRVLVPRWPGTLCAWGALHADVSSDFIRSVNLSVNDLGAERGTTIAEQLSTEASEWLHREAPPTASHELQWSADMRYKGQSYEIEVPVQAAWVRQADVGELVRAFHTAHERVFSHSDAAGAVEITSVRLRALGIISAIASSPTATSTHAKARTSSSTNLRGDRRWALFDGKRHMTAVHERDELDIGKRLEGPAVIEQDDSTVVVPPSWSAEVGVDGTLLLVRGRLK